MTTLGECRNATMAMMGGSTTTTKRMLQYRLHRNIDRTMTVILVPATEVTSNKSYS
jgi:hypothetical protein